MAGSFTAEHSSDQWKWAVEAADWWPQAETQSHDKWGENHPSLFFLCSPSGWAILLEKAYESVITKDFSVDAGYYEKT